MFGDARSSLQSVVTGHVVLSLTVFRILFVQNESHLITFPFVLKLFSVKHLNIEKYKNKGQQDSSSKKGLLPSLMPRVLVLETYMVEGENQLPRVLLLPPHVHLGMCTHAHKINKRES